MLRAAVVFFLIGLFALILGANQLAGVSIEIGRLILFIFLGLAVIGIVTALIAGNRVAGSRTKNLP
jgi:uncharacterized membrane protein YtjA (UPF0391 family)